MLRNEKNRLTPESNLDLAENQRQIQEIYNQWRDKGYSVEEVYYMISTAAHECVLDEALTGKRRETKQFEQPYCNCGARMVGRRSSDAT